MDCGDNLAVVSSQIVEAIDETSNYAMLNLIEVYLNALEFEIECISLIRRVSEWKYMMEKTNNRVMIPHCKAIVPKVNLTAYYIFYMHRFNLLLQENERKFTTNILTQIMILRMKPYFSSAVNGMCDAVKLLGSYKDFPRDICVKIACNYKPMVQKSQDIYPIGFNTGVRQYSIRITSKEYSADIRKKLVGLNSVRIITDHKQDSIFTTPIECSTVYRQYLKDTNSVGISTDHKQDSLYPTSVRISSDNRQDSKDTSSIGISTDHRQDSIYTSSLGIGTDHRHSIDTISIGISSVYRQDLLDTSSIGISTDYRQNSIYATSVGINTDSIQDSLDKTSIGISTDHRQDSIYTTSVEINTDPIQDSILQIIKFPLVFNYSLWKATLCGYNKLDSSAYILNFRYFDDMLNLDPALDYINTFVEPLNSFVFLKTVLKDLGKTFLNAVIPCPI
ncbi:unnamed protein product [Pieris macdunnoughi]|uniref:Uncharacterized protein n=1 Tax=Pieris macdunnoughi TaxID=345717 RepID=A0A821VZ56_9NEOP|nr:unnamed protein product [Pieris macdunnoughi]